VTKGLILSVFWRRLEIPTVHLHDFRRWENPLPTLGEGSSALALRTSQPNQVFQKLLDMNLCSTLPVCHPSTARNRLLHRHLHRNPTERVESSRVESRCNGQIRVFTGQRYVGPVGGCGVAQYLSSGSVGPPRCSRCKTHLSMHAYAYSRYWQ
jgi:hypothetical protein